MLLARREVLRALLGDPSIFSNGISAIGFANYSFKENLK